VADLLEAFVKNLDENADESTIYKIRLISTVVSATVALYPLALIKNMSGLAMFSILSIIAILYVVILLLVEFPSYFIKYHPDHHILWFQFDDAILDSVAITFFAFTCHAGLFPIYSELA
jgi:amino acid permease